MPDDVDFLFVVGPSDDDYVLEDIAAAIRWACTRHTHYTVCLRKDGAPAPPMLRDGYQLVWSRAPGGWGRLGVLDPGFYAHVPAYKHAVLLSQRCLLTGVGLDAFLFERLATASFGVLGVEQVGSHESLFSHSLPLLNRWQVQHGSWESAPPVLADDFLVVTEQLLARRRFSGAAKFDCLPVGYQDWPGGIGAYLSWASIFLGLPSVSWGYTAKPLPPFYLRPHGADLPPPHILSPAFLVYAPVDRVQSYAELDLRDLYKKMRGEHAREVKPFGPVATLGPPSGVAQ